MARSPSCPKSRVKASSGSSTQDASFTAKIARATIAMRTMNPPITAAMSAVGEMRAAQAIRPAAASRLMTMIAMANAAVHAPSARQITALSAMTTRPRGMARRTRSRAMSSSGAATGASSATGRFPRDDRLGSGIDVQPGLVLLHAALVAAPALPGDVAEGEQGEEQQEDGVRAEPVVEQVAEEPEDGGREGQFDRFGQAVAEAVVEFSSLLEVQPGTPHGQRTLSGCACESSRNIEEGFAPRKQNVAARETFVAGRGESGRPFGAPGPADASVEVGGQHEAQCRHRERDDRVALAVVVHGLQHEARQDRGPGPEDQD